MWYNSSTSNANERTVTSTLALVLTNRKIGFQMATSDFTLTPFDYKRCTKGENCLHPDGAIMPATCEYFHANKDRKDGLSGVCKWCIRAQKKQYYVKTADEQRAKSKRYRQEHPDKIRVQNQQHREKNADKLKQYLKDWRAKNADYVKQKSREYNVTHKAENNKRCKAYREKNRPALLIKNKKWRDANHEYLRLSYRIKAQKRRARQRSLPANFTALDWLNAVNYFNGCCAACGRLLNDLFGTHRAHADHWVPLNSHLCPGTIPKNIVPLCGGQNGCNESKADKMPDEWLKSRFGARKAKRITRRIYEYFDSLGL